MLQDIAGTIIPSVLIAGMLTFLVWIFVQSVAGLAYYSNLWWECRKEGRDHDEENRRGDKAQVIDDRSDRRSG